MNKTIIANIIYTANISDNKIYLLSLNKDSLYLPQLDLSVIDPKKYHIDLISLVESIFVKYVNLDFRWTKPKLLDVNISLQESSNNITTAIYYGIYIPSNITTKNSFWTDVSEYVAYYPVIRKLLCLI